MTAPIAPRRRVFSPAFVARKIAQMDDLNERLRDAPTLPNPADGLSYAGVYQTCRKVAHGRYQQGYVDGFWMGWTLRDHAEEEVAG